METFFEKEGLANVAPAIFASSPMYYKANPVFVYGPDEPVVLPRRGGSVDFEIELAVAIGREGRDVALEEAASYIAGFMVLNDFTLRDRQREELSLPMNLYGLTKSKDVAGYGLGPCLVTPDEFDVGGAVLIVRINGEELVRETTAEMSWSFPELVEYSSRDELIRPGDVIAGGAPPRGCGAEIGRLLEPGDVVECEITGIGVLRNTVGRAEGRASKGVMTVGSALR